MSRSNVTATEALRRLLAATKLIDYADCEDETVWQALGAAQGTAEGVLRDREKQEPVAYLRFRAAQSWSGSGNHDIEHNEWLETCHAHEIGDDKLLAFPVYSGPANGMIAAADYIERKANEYLNEHATTEWDTGAVVFNCGEAGREYHSSLVELAEEIRSAAPQPAAAPTHQCPRDTPYGPATCAKCLAAAPSGDVERDAVLDDLSALARQLVHALGKAAPSHSLPARAMDYLKSKGLQGSPLRATITATKDN